jgi:nucleoid-associated protein YgaU
MATYGIDFGTGKPVKASIWNEDTNQKVVDCMFNPTEYTFSRTNQWTESTANRADVTLPTFSGSNPMKLTINNLVFDTYVRASEEPTPEDVRTYTEKVFNLMQIEASTVDSANGTPGRPPRVSFRCGTFFSFKSVITSVTQKFTLFWDDGRPVRAKLDITFQQVESQGTYPAQNPSSLGSARKVRVVGPDETIDAIAFAELGDASKWRLLASYNRIDNPLRLRPGQRIVIPRSQ